MSDPTINVQNLPLDKVVPNPWNANEMSDHAFNRLVDELKDVGFIDPIQVVPMNDGTFRILGGEHRYQAARVLGWETVPAVILSESKWQDVDLQKLVTVRLNVLRGKTNPEKMAKLYKEMADKYGEESLQQLFAYTDQDQWNKLVGAVSAGLKGSGLPKEIQDKFAQAAKEVKTVDNLSVILNQLFTKYGESLKYNFMVFTFGGKEHIYIAMNKEMKAAMDKVLDYCRDRRRDVNEILAPLTKEYVKYIEARKADEDIRVPPESDDVLEENVDFSDKG